MLIGVTSRNDPVNYQARCVIQRRVTPSKFIKIIRNDVYEIQAYMSENV